MKEPQKKKSEKHWIIAAGVVLILAVLLFLLLFRSCQGKAEKPEPLPESSGIVYDQSAVSGGWEEKTESEIVSELNEQVEQGMINISMNTSPVFETASSDGNLMIVNETVNRYPQVVEITRNDTGETIYKSAAIPVGSKIENGKLTAELPAGEYECTAHFTNVDPDTGALLGSAGAIIHVTVLN